MIPKKSPEDVAKAKVYEILDKMSKDGYSKGRDSFSLLEKLNADEVVKACPHVEELVGFLKTNNKGE